MSKTTRLRSGRFPTRNRSRFVVLMVVPVFLSGIARGEGIYIFTEDKVPQWNQIHDYRGTYGGRATNIETAPDSNVFVPYDLLAGDARTFFRRNGTVMNPGGRRPKVVLDPANPRSKFVDNDYYNAANNGGANLAGGGWHCGPASTAMYVEWARQTILKRLDDRGGEIKSIDDFAKAADINDYSFTLGLTPNEVHLGGYRPDLIAAANAYVDASSIFYGKTTFSKWNYTSEAYRQIINRGKAVVLYYGNLDPVTMQQISGHVVVGVGYDGATSEIIVRDPWEGVGDRRHNWNLIQQAGGPNAGAADIPYGVSDPDSAAFDAEWIGARLDLIEVPDYGDAPSDYLFGSGREASNRSGLREWLGASISSEIDPFDAIDDEEGIANVNNNDRYDDGILLGNLRPGQLAIGQAIVSSIANMSVDTTLGVEMPPLLNLDGWVDWNQDTLWTPDEKVLDLSLAADFVASQLLNFNFPVLGALGSDFWARFRLTRGEDLGPYGDALFGEIEDYHFTVVPEPTTAFALILGGVLCGCRRRTLR